MRKKDIFNGKAQVDGQHSRISQSTQAVFKTQAEFEKLWDATEGRVHPKPDTPELPADKMVVAVFMGSRSSGGYATKIEDVREENGKLVVEYTEARPDPGMMTTCVMTNPFSMKIVDKSDLPVEFKNITPPPAKPKNGFGFGM